MGREDYGFHALQLPARNVSLGVPTYGIRWTEVRPGTVQKAEFAQDNEGTAPGEFALSEKVSLVLANMFRAKTITTVDCVRMSAIRK